MPRSTSATLRPDSDSDNMPRPDICGGRGAVLDLRRAYVVKLRDFSCLVGPEVALASDDDLLRAKRFNFFTRVAKANLLASDQLGFVNGGWLSCSADGL